MPEVTDGIPQSNKLKFAGCAREYVKLLESLKQRATSYADTGRIKVVSSAVNSMPNVDANALELEEQNGGHRPAVS